MDARLKSYGVSRSNSYWCSCNIAPVKRNSSFIRKWRSYRDLLPYGNELGKWIISAYLWLYLHLRRPPPKLRNSVKVTWVFQTTLSIALHIISSCAIILRLHIFIHFVTVYCSHHTDLSSSTLHFDIGFSKIFSFVYFIRVTIVHLAFTAFTNPFFRTL